MRPSGGHPSGHVGNASVQGRLQLLAWETTQACSFGCPHCRASACLVPGPDELSTAEGRALLEDAARVGPSIVILSGGEPLLRTDLEALAAAGAAAGHTMVVACNDAERLTGPRILSLSDAGVKRFSFSIHYSRAEDYDRFVASPGAFERAFDAFSRLRAAKIPFQINTTVLPDNFRRMEDIRRMVIGAGAAAWHLFFVVRTGRAAGSGIENRPDAAETEELLRWVARTSDESPLPMKVTCAPQYVRIRAELGLKNPGRGRSCMAGDGFVFVGSTGDVKPCGYFDSVVGNVRRTPLSELYSGSPLFAAIRRPDDFGGECGVCPHRKLCGGCRARALSAHGDYLAADPGCLGGSGGKGPDLDKGES